MEAISKKRFLVIGQGNKPDELDVLGMKAVYRDFDELDALYKEVDPEAVDEKADTWIKQAEKVVEPTPPASP